MNGTGERAGAGESTGTVARAEPERGRMLPLRLVARRIGYGEKTVRRLMVAGRFPRQQRVLGNWRIPEGDVERFLAEEAQRS